jgi:hypothetical protein
MKENEMSEQNQKLEERSDVDLYGDSGIASGHAPPPKWLIVSNTFFTIFGLVCLYLFWNGSFGWLDRGYWSQLQRAANTTYPYTTREIVEKEATEKQKSNPKTNP